MKTLTLNQYKGHREDEMNGPKSTLQGEGARQSRHDAMGESFRGLRQTIEELEKLTDELVGSEPAITGENMKEPPDPNNIAFLINKTPGIMYSFSERITHVTSRLRNELI